MNPFQIIINNKETKMTDHDFFDHDREGDRKRQYRFGPFIVEDGKFIDPDDVPDLCDVCKGPRNAHLDNDGCDTCKECLDAEQLVDTCEWELEIAQTKLSQAKKLENAAWRAVHSTQGNLDEARHALRLRKN